MIKNSIVKFLCIVGIGVALIFINGILLAKYGPDSVISTSPDNEHQVSYNKNTNVITVFHSKLYGTGTVSHVCEPTVLWSSDSHYLALSYTLMGDAGGYIFNEIYDVWNFGYTFRTEYTSYLIAELYAVIDAGATQFKIIEFVDDQNVLVEFVAEDKSGKEKISGWYIYDLENASVKDVTFLD